MRANVSDEVVSLRPLLIRDHERLDGLFAELLQAFRTEDWATVRAAWTHFETGLLAHLDAEERYLLPLFARAEPGEAAELRAEHGAFRKLLAELGVGVDLHAVSLAVADALVSALRAHALREDVLFYRWAGRHVAPERQAEASRTLAQGARRAS
jgi:hypothetical protein